ncbi:MAG TPA: hypothetical protein DDY78_24510 [Planctomycetales bacterium]|nr:hypothetical protein [Planctomycetales bacterium]
MKATVNRLGALLLAGLAALGGLAPTAYAQFNPNRFPSNFPVFTPQPINPNFQIAPGLRINQAAFNTAVMGRALGNIPPYAFGFNPYSSPLLNSSPFMPGGGFPSPMLSTNGGLGGFGGFPSTASLSTNPYGSGSSLTTGGGGYGGSSYGGGYGEDPGAGFLRGTSDVIREQGNYLKNVQSARIIQTSADTGRLDYRRRLIEEARYERMSQPTAEETRQLLLAGELNRARHEPPISDIISARSLNDLLHHLANDPARPKGPNIAVDDEVLKKINVTGVNPNGASVGLLKEEGNLQWPQPLMTGEFKAPRELLSKTLRNAVQNLKSGESVGSGSLNDLKTDLAQLNLLVSKSELSATDFIEAKSYLDQVAGAVRALGDKDVASYFNHRFNAKNVAELVDDMRTKGLDFAPAAPGDEGAYRALQQALAAYDYIVSPPASAKPAPTPPEVKQP